MDLDVHKYYWNGRLEDVRVYCEKDVNVCIEISKKMYRQMKICSKCFTEKDLNFFQKEKIVRMDIDQDCKECRNNFYSIDYSIENNFYVYVHRKKSDNEIFYVGKGVMETISIYCCVCEGQNSKRWLI